MCVNLYAHFFKSMFLLFLLEDAVYFINLSEEAILYIIIIVIIIIINNNDNKQLLDTELHDFKKA